MHKIFRTKCPRDSSLTAFLLTNSHVYLYPSSSSSTLLNSLSLEKKMAEPIFLMSRNLLLLKHNDCYKTFWYLPEFMWQLWGRRLVSFFFYIWNAISYFFTGQSRKSFLLLFLHSWDTQSIITTIWELDSHSWLSFLRPPKDQPNGPLGYLLSIGRQIQPFL